MHRITLTIILLLSATCADAAWYQKTDGTIVDPIQNLSGGDHEYSKGNLEPSAVLEHLVLTGADLSDADLSDAHLTWAYIESADLSGADLSGATVIFGFFTNTDLSGANLSGSDLTKVLAYNNATWTGAFYYTDNEPAWSSYGSGMDAAWRASEGILALAPTSAVPEPSTLLLALFGLALVPRKRRR